MGAICSSKSNTTIVPPSRSKNECDSNIVTRTSEDRKYSYPSNSASKDYQNNTRLGSIAEEQIDTQLATSHCAEQPSAQLIPHHSEDQPDTKTSSVTRHSEGETDKPETLLITYATLDVPFRVKSNRVPRDQSNMSSRTQTSMILTTTDIDLETIKTENPQLRDTFQGFEEAARLIKVEVENECIASDLDSINQVMRTQILRTFDDFPDLKQREVNGTYMAHLGLVENLVDLYKYVIEDMYEAFTLDTMNDSGREMLPLKTIREILWNFSDQSMDFRLAIAKTKIMFGFLAKDLQEMANHEFPEITKDAFPFSSAVNIIHNCARSAITKDSYMVALQPGGGAMVSLQVCLKPFLRSEDKYVKLITLLALSHILDDQENKELLTADKTLFDFLLEMIRDAMPSEDRRSHGFSVEELLDGLAHLAKNDDNKSIIMGRPTAYSTIKEIVNRGDVAETIAAVRTIWELAFNKENRMKIKKDTEFWATLIDLKKSKDKELAHVSSYTCFVILGDDDDETTADSLALAAFPDQQKRGQIMISYNWTHQHILLKVYAYLTSVGFTVWMDVDQMKGNLLDAMAEAVLGSEVVLLCVSEQYGKSLNCRSEAEFARKKGKSIIPLMMQEQPNIQPWLDLLLGNKLYYKFCDFDINDEPKFEGRMRDVIKDIRTYVEPGPPSQQLPSPQQTTSAASSKQQKTSSEISGKSAKLDKKAKTYETKIDTWTEDDLQNWLKDNRIHTYAGMKSLTCEQLSFLVKISGKAPEFFYRTLKEEVGLKGLEQLMRVSNAIEELA